MTESDQEAIHTRLDYMEKEFNTNMTHMAKEFNTNMSQMAASIKELATEMTKLAERVSDVSLLTERSNQQSAQIKNNDSRIDKIEQKVPTYDQIVEDKKNNSLMIRRAFIGSIIGVTVVGMLGLVWVAIVN